MADLPSSLANDLGIKLKTARQAAGLSMRQVASKISARHSLTHATISNYETGKTIPSLEVLAVLAGFYGRSLNWFLESGPVLTNVHYRSRRSGIKVRERLQFEAEAQQWLEAYRRLEAWLEAPLRHRHSNFKVEVGSSGRKAAESLREHLNLQSDRPIRSVTELLGDFAIRVIELQTHLPIDGLAARFGEENAIVLNPEVANDRCRMNAAHELGHVLLDDCLSECGHDSGVIEKRAYEFASHLLISEDQLNEAFSRRSMVRLINFKEYFGVSLQAMIYRARQNGLLKESEAKWLWIEFAKRGWRKEEPGQVRPDRATRFEELLSGAVGEGRLTWMSAAKLMRVPEAELNKRLNIALGGRTGEVEEKGDDTTADTPRILRLRDK